MTSAQTDSNAQAQIRQLIEDRAKAVRAKDVDGALVNVAPDTLSFARASVRAFRRGDRQGLAPSEAVVHRGPIVRLRVQASPEVGDNVAGSGRGFERCNVAGIARPALFAISIQSVLCGYAPYTVP